jgi:hypothetical protein
MYENEVRRHERELDKQRTKQAEHEKKAAKAEQEALRLESEAARASSISSASNKARQAGNKRSEANKARQAAAAASQAFATAQKKLFEAQSKLSKARAAEGRKADDKARREADRERRLREQQERRREGERQEQDRRRQQEIQQLRSHAVDLEQQLATIAVVTAPPEITVLFIAASPEDQQPLRLDREVREIQQKVRASDYRDSVRFEHRPATQLGDLIQMLNEVRPDVVHFSGHGSQHALAFEDSDGRTRPLPNDQLAALLHSSSERIRLAVFNSCESSKQAELATLYMDAAIGMELTVDDEAAKIFAGQLYNSLGFGKPLSAAFNQACLQVELETGVQSGSPRLFTAAGVEADEVVLVSS